MKLLIKYRSLFLFFFTTALLFSCKKDELKKIEETVPAQIGITGAVDGKINVKADDSNVEINKAEKTATASFGINRSGLQAKEAYSVKISTNNTNLPAGVVPISGDDYSIIVAGKAGSTSIEVPAGQTSANFYVRFSKSLIDANAGKQVGFNVVISEPSKYRLNEAISAATIIINAPSFSERQIDVTSKYLKNAGAPFKRSDNSTSRFGILADWITNDAVKNIDNNTKGGFDSNGGGGFMSMERWWTPEISNGKIYQTVTLPNGKYRFSANFETAVISDQLFLTVAEGVGLPDVADINSAIASSSYSSPQVDFALTAQKEVSIGIVGNLINNFQAFRIRHVKLYKFESPFDQ